MFLVLVSSGTSRLGFILGTHRLGAVKQVVCRWLIPRMARADWIGRWTFSCNKEANASGTEEEGDDVHRVNHAWDMLRNNSVRGKGGMGFRRFRPEG